MKTWIVEVKLQVADSWVADGFNVDEARITEIEDQLAYLIPCAYGHELKITAKVKKSPAKDVINKLQGYQAFDNN